MRWNCLVCLLGLLLWYPPVGAADPDWQALKAQTIEARNRGNMNRADALASQLLDLAGQTNQTEILATAHYQLARNAMERNQYPQAQNWLTRAIEGFQSVNDQTQLANSYQSLGMSYRYQSNYSLALEYNYLALQMFQQLQDTAAIATSHNSIGVILEKMGQYEEAAQAHQKSLELNYALGDDVGVASSLYNLGDIRRQMGDYDQALQYFTDALALDEASGNQKNIAYSKHKIGYLLNTLGRRDEAREYIQAALDTFRAIQTPRDTDWALTSMAQLEMDSGHFDIALDIVDGVIVRAAAGQYKSLLVDAYKVAAELAYRTQRFEDALDFIELGVAQAKENKERADEAIFEALRVKVHLADDSLQNAFEALQRQKRIDDEVFNRKRLEAIARVQAQTEFIRRENQIALLEKEKALQHARLREQELARTLWIIGLVSAAVLSFLLYGRLMQRMTNRKLAGLVRARTEELEEKNRQLAFAYDEMEAISLTDRLTSLHNRRFLETHIQADLQKSFRAHQDWLLGKTGVPQQQDIVVFVIDMDHFKVVNDTHGHHAGDRVLVQLAGRMADVFRHSDYLVRWGGEEFVAVARFIPRSDAVVIAERMRKAVNDKPFQLTDELTSALSCSIGFACFPVTPDSHQSCSWKTLMAMADAALYEAKEAGRNTWVGVERGHHKVLGVEDITPKRFKQWVQNGTVKLMHCSHSGPLNKVSEKS